MNTGERKKAKTKKCYKKDSKQDIASCQQPPVINFVPNFTPDYNFGYLNMFFQGQGQGMSQPMTQQGQGMSQPMPAPMSQPMNQSISQPPYMQNSPPPQFASAFGFQASAPPWAAKLLDDMDQVKQKLQGIDKIEKTVNLINTKVSGLALKMSDLDKRLTENEKSCQFISNSNEQSKKDLKSQRRHIKYTK